MGLLDDYRAKFPQYDKIPDDQLEDALYKKYYADKMPRSDFYKTIGAKDVAKEIASGSAPVSGEVVKRGSVLPLGRTKEGNIVPALPQWAADAVSAIRKGIDTGDLSPKDAMSIASIVAPDAKGALEGIGAGVSDLRNLTKPNIQSTSELKAASQSLYKGVEDAGVRMKPDTFREMVSEIIPDVKKAGFDKDIEPKAAAALRRFQSEIDLGNAQSLSELDILRQVAGSAAKSQDANERRISRIITSKMDDFLDNAKPEQFSGGNTKEGVEKLKQARELWAKQAKSGQIDEMLEKALNRASGTPSLGLEGQIRNQFKALADNPNRLRRFSKDEQDAIKTVARGSGSLQEAMVKIGKFSPNAGFFAAVLSGSIGLEALQNPKLLALPIAGAIARWGATKIRQGQANRVSEMVRGGKEAASFFKKRSELRKGIQRNASGATIRPGLVVGSSLLPQDSDYSTP